MMSSRPLSQSSNSSSSSSNNNTNNSRMMMMLVDDSSSSSSSPPSAASAHATLPSPSAPALPPPPEHLCCVHCNYCGTILAVGVPLNSLFKIVTVKCGHCNHLLSVNMGAAALPPELAQAQRQYTEVPKSSPIEREQLSTTLLQEDAQKLLTRVDAPPEKRARLPSVYNRFIKAEIQRIKANNPEIKHKEAFSAAAKNWAHYPHIKFGMMLDKGRQCPEDKESTNAMMNNDGKQQSNFW